MGQAGPIGYGAGHVAQPFQVVGYAYPGQGGALNAPALFRKLGVGAGGGGASALEAFVVIFLVAAIGDLEYRGYDGGPQLGLGRSIAAFPTSSGLRAGTVHSLPWR